MAVSKKAKAIYTDFFDGMETFAANTISNIQEIKYLRNNINKEAHLTHDQEKKIKEFWAPYCRISPKWALYYSAQNGKFDPRYIPNTLYYTKIDQYFNARKLGYGFNDKNYYSKIFADVSQPKIIVRKINSFLYDSEYNRIDQETAIKLICSENETICKPSQETGSGRDISFFSSNMKDEIITFIKGKKYDDYIVQALVKQHRDLDRLHKGSLNTIRVCSLLLEDGVAILSAVLRMGVGNSRVDNATAGDNSKYDGMTCGINKYGRLNKYAYGYYKGQRFEQHPDGVKFDGFVVPSYDRVISLIQRIHPRIGHFRLVSWDIAIDEKGEPILIEANMRKGSINFHQFNNGPLFGDLTEKVLSEVFGKKNKGLHK